MARLIPHRELRNNSAAVLRDVQAGETIEVTNHGEVVAILVPPARREEQPLRIRPARIKGGFSTLPRSRVAQPSQQVLDDLRGER
jgi:prevent-host-death family protein